MNVALPGGLAPPLSFPGTPFAGCSPLALLAILGTAWLLYRWWRRRRRAMAVAPPAPPVMPRELAPPADAIDDLEARHLAAETYRQGCHELADLLRRDATWGIRDAKTAGATTLTARELARASSNTSATRLMSKLARHRFARAAPGRRDFRIACTLARAVLVTGTR